MKIYLKNAAVIRSAYDPPAVRNILIQDDMIAGFPVNEPENCERTVDLSGKVVVPGMVQTHVHLCQVLFRGLADDLPLMSWLKYKIWPMEAAHDEESTYLSAMIGITEMISGGVTTVCDMESVRHAGQAAKAIRDSGMRALFGKVLMDYNDTPEELGGMPASFFEDTETALSEAQKLIDRWHGAENGRIRYAYMPRGILTTTEDLLRRLKDLAEMNHCLIHTHACETEPESLLVKERRGSTEIKYLDRLGLTGENLLLAHCQFVDEEDIRILRETGTKVASCPIANLKLGSGIAPLERMRREGITISLGSDGAPCNNTLDMFQEMRFASLLQKGVLHDPEAMKAEDVFHMATQGGAEALGLGDEIGTLEEGKKADLAVLDLSQYQSVPVQTAVSSLVYSGNRNMVESVMIDGHWVYWKREFPDVDVVQIRREAEKSLHRILKP